MIGDPAGDPPDPAPTRPVPLPSPFVVDIQMRFRDTDRLGHVNNATVATYAEIGRLEYFRAAGANLTSMILARLALDFRRQIYLGQSVQIDTRTLRISTSSITIRQQALAARDVATALESVIPCFASHAPRPAPAPGRPRSMLLPAGTPPPAPLTTAPAATTRTPPRP